MMSTPAPENSLQDHAEARGCVYALCLLDDTDDLDDEDFLCVIEQHIATNDLVLPLGRLLRFVGLAGYTLPRLPMPPIGDMPGEHFSADELGEALVDARETLAAGQWQVTPSQWKNAGMPA